MWCVVFYEVERVPSIRLTQHICKVEVAFHQSGKPSYNITHISRPWSKKLNSSIFPFCSFVCLSPYYDISFTSSCLDPQTFSYDNSLSITNSVLYFRNPDSTIPSMMVDTSPWATSPPLKFSPKPFLYPPEMNTVVQSLVSLMYTSWFIVQDDHGSKKTYRPQMSVDVRCFIHLWWSCLIATERPA